jgi:putative FmdB family regulatory protein
MPIYEFRCKDCNNDFETLVLGSGDRVECPKCKGTCLERLMSACAFKSGESFTPAKGSSGCSSCSSHNCSTCH